MTTIQDLLYGLNPKSKLQRIIRRGLIIAILTGVAVVVKDLVPDSPEYLVPILAGVLSAVEKLLREV